MRDYLKRIAAVICAATLLFSSISFGEGETSATPTDLMPAGEMTAEEEKVGEENAEEGQEPIPADRTVTLEPDQTLTGELDGDSGKSFRIRLAAEQGTSWTLVLTAGQETKATALPRNRLLS